jgi:arylsulfatase A-like enzyme
MPRRIALSAVLLGGLAVLQTAPPAAAQTASGAPDATRTINGRQLPAPPMEFGGVIKDDALNSTPWWAPRIVPPKEAPNILLIITDDAGLRRSQHLRRRHPDADHGRAGGDGLRYNNIHSTALCSPTRAALITGRNHHSAGFGVISEQSTGFPGYNSIIAKDKATIGRILLDNGYATPGSARTTTRRPSQASQAGPFDQWPTGMGFEYFYGFVGGDANQWQPNLFRNTTQIYPFEGKPGWNLITGMADDAIDYITRMHQIDPEQALLRQVRARRHPRAAPSDQGMGGKDRAMHLFDDGYEQAARDDLREPEEAGRDSRGRELTALAEDILKPWDQLTDDREEALHPAGRGLRRLRRLPTTRSAA